MDHDRAVILAVGGAVLQFEASRQYEIDLHRAELPRAADRVAHVDVELGAVERAAALVDVERQLVALERVANRVLRRSRRSRCDLLRRASRARTETR